MRRGHLIAVAVSALLGVACGVVGGFVLDRHRSAYPDPLRLGVALVNQPCTHETLLVVARGNGSAQLGATVASEQDVHYLDTRDSCPTAWNDPGAEVGRYAAYLGPYDSPTQACPARMTRRGGFVTRLVSGTTEPVQCLCYLSFASMPTLRSGMDANAVTSAYVRSLQRLLTTLHLNPETHKTGIYDVQTVEQIRRFQHDHALPPNGVVKRATWEALVRQGCAHYTS